MMFAWLATWFFGALVMPVTNALMSHRVAANAQGELQGAVASLFSLSSIAGPPLMTQLFGRFSAPGARVHLPGAAFFAAAALATCSLVIYWVVSRQPAGRPIVAEADARAGGP
jgi:DHA1 family tetracycline resistance protein-like MFS transporter